MKLHTLFSGLILFLNQCSGGANFVEKGVPACILEKIESLQEEPVRNPPAYIAEYQYEERKVYYIPPAAGDQMSELYDESCALICRPEGGITGMGDGKCAGFLEERCEEKMIWKDERM